MFKFEEYPQIENARKERIRLTNLAFKAEIKAYRSKKEKHDKLWEQAIENQMRFTNVDYAKVVFDTFAPLKPDLTSSQIGAVYSWDELYGEDFSVLSDSMKRSLPMLVEEEKPYRLPDKYYYDEKTAAEMRRRENEKSDKAEKIRKGLKWLAITVAAVCVGAFVIYLFEN